MSKFTIQNVPIKWKIKYFCVKNLIHLQYKMFLLNVELFTLPRGVALYLQYKMFLLNKRNRNDFVRE